MAALLELLGLAAVFGVVVGALSVGLVWALWPLRSRGEVADAGDFYAPDVPREQRDAREILAGALVEVRARSAAGIDELIQGVDEPTDADRERDYVAAILDEACDDLASFFAAEALGADPMTCQLWMDRVWDRLRDLDDEQRVHAVVLLLTADAREGAKALSDVEGVLR